MAIFYKDISYKFTLAYRESIYSKARFAISAFFSFFLRTF